MPVKIRDSKKNLRLKIFLHFINQEFNKQFYFFNFSDEPMEINTAEFLEQVVIKALTENIKPPIEKESESHTAHCILY